MKTKLMLLGALMMVSQLSFGQRDLRLGWAMSSMQPNSTSPISVESDPNGNSVSVGRFSGAKDFDPSATSSYFLSSTTTTIYIQKLGVNGDLVWARSLEGSGSPLPRQVRTDKDNNVYIVGRYSGTVDFNPDPNQTVNRTALVLNSVYYHNPFVLKLDPNGNFLWVYTAEGNGIDDAVDVGVDSQGNVYTTGHYHNTISFTPGNGHIHMSLGNSVDVFVVKLNKFGTFQWANTTGLWYRDEPSSLVVGSDDHVYCSGTYDDNIGHRTAYIQRIAPNNQVDYVKNFPLNGVVSRVTDLELDSEDNVYMSGEFTSITDFDPNSGVSYLQAIGSTNDYLVSLGSNGQFRWAKTFTGSVPPVSMGSLSIDAQDNIFWSGHTGGHQFQIMQYEKTQGVLVKDYQFTTNGYTLLTDISRVSKCGLYLTGLYSNATIDADPSANVSNVSSGSGNKSFLIKLDLEVSNLNPAFTYKVCSNRVHVRGVNQPIATNPYSDWHLIEYFPGTQIPDADIESIYWWQQPSPYRYSTQEISFNHILQPGHYYYVKHGLHGECTGWKERREYGIVRNNVACKAKPDLTFGRTTDTVSEELGVATQEVIIYPNPASDVVNVNSEFGMMAYRITDSSGREVKKDRQDSQVIDVADLASGTYNLEIQTIKGTFTELLIKK